MMKMTFVLMCRGIQAKGPAEDSRVAPIRPLMLPGKVSRVRCHSHATSSASAIRPDSVRSLRRQWGTAARPLDPHPLATVQYAS